MNRYDVVIVGAGPAGLTAATYLGRFRRRTLILDGGPSRAAWIPTSHNTPGFAGGIGGEALLEQMGEQAALYGAERRAARAQSLTRTAEGFTLLASDAAGEIQRIDTRFVLLATGVVDRLPPLEGIEAAIRAAIVRICPICDAYEAIDQAIAVLGDGDLGAREAAFLTTYSKDVTLLHLGSQDTLSDRVALEEHGVAVVPVGLQDLTLSADGVELRSITPPRRFDCLYLALGCEMQSRLALSWGAAHDADDNLIVDGHQQTSIEGLYAAGDVVRGLNQIAVAAAEAAIAASDIHKQLRTANAGALTHPA
ncbi:NAD(P)/FAD-dependent oxidoreductase [Caulobacter endophyticus]|uniref:Thioredoxin reductase n=1 Tax=Caulobacter endophyticus TaxID=2172652 RepID=A0A2T9JI61_9CAUL|nr:NAD(P)/FAD-dependent oxidoreductase [Caulobacter endophyticus]PVM83385.1 NAD(P)/FAD-dependent oxidoreductase [Caulobacter endophyticus]